MKMEKERLGVIRVSDELLFERCDGLINNLIPEFEVRAVFNDYNGVHTYYGIHPEFDEIDTIREKPPEYTFTWEKTQDGSAMRLPAKRL